MIQQKPLETSASLVSFLHEFATYNEWANQRLIDWLMTKPAHILEQEVASSFPSLKLTMVHIWDVQRSWLAHLQQVPPPPSFRFEYTGTLEDVWTGFEKQSKEFTQYVGTLTEQSLQQLCKFLVPIRWPEWDEFEKTRFEIIQHCLTHSGYHREQVITIARNVGLTDIPMTDYMYYLLLVKDREEFRTSQG
jgi:uncharacterized damage-inducible protein DinB